MRARNLLISLTLLVVLPGIASGQRALRFRTASVNGRSTSRSLGVNKQSSAPSAPVQRIRDAKGRIATIIEPGPTGRSSYTTNIRYDAFGEVTSIEQHGASNDAVRERTFHYDADHRITSVTSPESGTTSYAYSSDGSLASKTDARGSTTSYLRNNGGLLTSQTYTDGTPSRVFDYYSPDNHLKLSGLGTLTHPDSAREYSYAPDGTLRGVTIHMPGTAAASYWVSVQRDGQGTVKSITYPDGRVFDVTWTTQGDLSSITSGGHPIYSISQDEIRAQSVVLLGDDLTLTSTQQKGGRYRRVLTSKNSSLVDTTFLYARDGSLSSTLDALYAERSTSYQFDQLRRVRTASGAATEQYTYDAFGNYSPPGTALTFDGSNRITGGSGYLYDAAGEMTFDGFHSYEYTGDGLILSVDNGASRYSYDAEGNRIRKESADGIREYIWFGNKVIAEKGPDGRWIDYVYAGGNRIASLQQKETRPNDAGSTKITFFVTSTSGITRTAISENGDVQATGSFTPYGMQIRGDQAAAQISFSDEIYDPETGLDTYHYRSYNPRLGRWMTPDPSVLHFSRLDNPQTFNQYSYVVDNPLKYWDSLGLSSPPDCGTDDCGGGGGGGGDPCDVDACVTTPDPCADGSCDPPPSDPCDWEACGPADPNPPPDPNPAPDPNPDPNAPPSTTRSSPTPKTFADIKAPPEVPGYLAIVVDVPSNGVSSGPVDGHAWLVFQTDDGTIYTYSTWGNSNGAQKANGIEQNTELSFNFTTTRSEHIGAIQAAALSGYISEMLAKGPDAWTVTSPCSGFASEGWLRATGEFLDPAYHGVLNDPTNLQNAMRAANNGS
jgi:RHS repeat-associated protein